jgi:DNA-binding GntR family transcriptional regulator
MLLVSKTKHFVAYERLREDIIRGKLRPGQKMIISNLAKEFGFSETPVREAIRRLESDGYVTFISHTGAVVRKIAEDELLEIYLIRIELECLATRLAVPHITDKDIAFLNDKNIEMEIAIQQNKYRKLYALNRDFHSRIYRAAPFPYINKTICDLWDRFERLHFVLSYVHERAVASIREHETIIQALKKKDVNLTVRLIREQKEHTLEAIKTLIAGGIDYSLTGKKMKKVNPVIEINKSSQLTGKGGDGSDKNIWHLGKLQ